MTHHVYGCRRHSVSKEAIVVDASEAGPVLAVLAHEGLSLVGILATHHHYDHVSGNEARYTVVSIKRNGGLKDKEFSFAPPKGTEIVDMRDQ